MTYGLVVLNGDNQTVIDSRDSASSLLKVNSGSVSGGNFEYPSEVDVGDLFFVRLPSSGTVAENMLVFGQTRTVYSTVTGSKDWIKASTMAGNVSSHNSGYGLNVFTSAGTAASNLIFSSVPGDALDIVAVGSYNSISGSSVVLSINSTAPHYVLIPGTVYYNYPGGAWPANFPLLVNVSYDFSYSGSTLSTITVNRYIFTGGASNTPISYGNQSYMIIRLRSD
tara:strand:- start:8287 stop:8958 length:672 start_codon:yes stop_codon:yes gene_type:complete